MLETYPARQTRHAQEQVRAIVNDLQPKVDPYDLIDPSAKYVARFVSHAIVYAAERISQAIDHASDDRHLLEQM